jgi:RNA polymerase sigma-70 factor (ECF subfamily)
MADGDDLDAFHAGVRPRLWGWLRRVCGDGGLADEVVQEAFVRLLDGRGAALPWPERRAYLFGIAWRVLADARREARRRAPLSAAPESGTEEILSPGSHRMAEVLEALPERQRALLWLAHAEGWSHREIAHTMGLAEGSVRVLLHRARSRAAALLSRSREKP